MTLFIVSLLPLSFLSMALYSWRSKTRRRYVYSRWIVTLILGAIWAASTVRLFFAPYFDLTFQRVWGIVGSYAFTLTIISLLITTFRQIKPSKSQNRFTIGISLFLGIGAFILDSRLWRVLPEDLVISSQPISQFYLWTGVWVASWFIPLLSVIILTRRTSASLSRSLFRNLLNYWQLMLFFFLVGGFFNSINQMNQSGWHQLGVILAILGAGVGTYTITHSQLPDLLLGIRHLFSRLSGTLIIFALSFGALTYLTRIINSPDNADGSLNLLVAIAAALFAGLFTVFYRFINDFSQRLFLPAEARRQIIMSDYANAIGNLPEPEQLGRLALRIAQSTLGTDDAWFFELSDGAGGRLILKPLASLSDNLPKQTVALNPKSPIANYLRRHKSPLVQYDIDSLEHFADISDENRALLAKWERILFMPLHVGDSLVGLLALGEKRSGQSYNRSDYINLNQFSEQISPLLAQAQNLASLQKINNFVFKQNQALSREQRHLNELVKLYKQFAELISPELIQPFSKVGNLTRQIETANEASEISPAMVADLGGQLEHIKRKIDNLVTLSNRIESRKPLLFGTVRFNDVIDTAVHQLDRMASARRVKIETDIDPTLPPVLGDHEQLIEAVYHLLHNAIKYNKIGGVVRLSSTVENGRLLFKVVDTGVGIPEDRLNNLWSGFVKASKNGQSRGNGMGLSLVNFIVSSHGGTIDVQSNYGSSTVFALTLPLLDEEV